MRAVLSRAGRDLRRGWRSWLALVLIAGLLGGIVLGLVAGARRTDTAYDRFLVSQRAFSQFLFTTPFYPGTAGISPEQLADMRTVAAVAPGLVFDGSPDVTLRGSTDPRLDRSLNAVNLLAGRLPDPAEPHEILVPVLFAERKGLTVGSTVSFRLRTWLTPEGEGPTIVTRVAGIGIAPGEFPPDNDIGTTLWVHVTPAFVERYADMGAPFAYVFLNRGDQDLEAFQAELSAKTDGAPVIGYQQASLTKNVRRAFRLQAVSLVVLAAMLAATALGLISQTISRMTWLEARDNQVLSAVGMTRLQLTMLGLFRVAAAAFAASLVAGTGAFLLSPLMPTGRARLAVLDPGFTFDTAVILLGMAVLFAVMIGWASVPAFRSARLVGAQDDRSEDRSRLADAAQRWGLSPSATTGMRFALERGRGSTAVPTRATILGAAVAVGGIAMSLTFGAGLNHLLETPRLYGSVYELIGNPGATSSAADAPVLVAKVRRIPGVADATAAAIGMPFRVEGELADGEGIDPDARAFLPPLLSGRYPRGPDEIMLGPVTLRTIARRVGDRVEVSALGTVPKTFRIVGSGVIPSTGHSANLGEGSLVSTAALRELFPDDGTMGNLLVKLQPGASRDEVAEAVRRAAGPILSSVYEPQEPGDLVNFGGQRNLPAILAAVLAGLAVLSVAHALMTTVNRRRRDIAVLRTIGFSSAQSRRTVRWQAGTLAIAGLLVGLPAGVATGRWLWLTYAGRIGIVPEGRVPSAALVVVVPATLLIAIAVGWLPSRRAARVLPAETLRAE